MPRKTKANNYKLEIYNSETVPFNDIILIFKSFGLPALQSEQCAMIIHNTGKYSAFHGTYDEMRSMQLTLSDNNIQSEIISDESKPKTKKIKT
jgi:hypothetical protein